MLERTGRTILWLQVAVQVTDEEWSHMTPEQVREARHRAETVLRAEIPTVILVQADATGALCATTEVVT